MADSQNSQNEKARKPRPFGSFLLFLTVLVVVLLAFGGSHLKNRTTLTQDQFEYALYTGAIQQMVFKGQTEIEGQLENGGFFKVSFATLEDKEAAYQQLNAIGEYHKVSQNALERAISVEFYHPESY